MKIGTPKEVFDGENRVAMTPDSAKQLQKLGYECAIEAGAGLAAGFSDATYEEAGVEIIKTPAALWKAVDIVAKVRPPEPAEVAMTKDGQVLISFVYPAQNEDHGEARIYFASGAVANITVSRMDYSDPYRYRILCSKGTLLDRWKWDDKDGGLEVQTTLSGGEKTTMTIAYAETDWQAY